MKIYKKTVLGAVITAATLAVIGCDTAEDTVTQNATEVTPTEVIEAALPSEQEKLITLLESYYQENLQRSPIFASFRGSKQGYDQWGDQGIAFQDETHKINVERRKKLDDIDEDSLDAQAKITLAISKSRLDRSINQYQYRNNNYVMQQFRSWHTTVPSVLINIHRVSTEKDLQAYIARLEDVSPLFDQVFEQMRVQAELGVFPPRWSYPQMLEASRNVVSGVPFDDDNTSENPIFADFKAKLEALGLSDEDSADYLQKATSALRQSVLPAYQQMIVELESQLEVAPEGDGVWRLPNGENYYNALLKFYTTTELTADEIHALGLENVERIHNEMRVIMKQVGFDGDLQAFFAFMREDQQFFYPETDQGRADYLAASVATINEMREVLPEYFGILPKAELTVKRVEEFREKSAGKAFYQGPPPDGSRPGIYYVNLFQMADMPKYQMEALAYHEGIPGHHNQLAITAELEGLPEFQKNARFTAFTEGWGLYSEYIGKEMGFYKDPYSDFGRLAMELWRACRLVVDSGIHAKKWSREDAIQYLQDNTPNPANDTVKAIERYIVYPGQATAYLVGKIKILELRESAKLALGEKFDIRKFHDLVLKDGPMPLSMLESKINAWVADVKQSSQVSVIDQ